MLSPKAHKRFIWLFTGPEGLVRYFRLSHLCQREKKRKNIKLGLTFHTKGLLCNFLVLALSIEEGGESEPFMPVKSTTRRQGQFFFFFFSCALHAILTLSEFQSEDKEKGFELCSFWKKPRKGSQSPNVYCPVVEMDLNSQNGPGK